MHINAKYRVRRPSSALQTQPLLMMGAVILPSVPRRASRGGLRAARGRRLNPVPQLQQLLTNKPHPYVINIGVNTINKAHEDETVLAPCGNSTDYYTTLVERRRTGVSAEDTVCLQQTVGQVDDGFIKGHGP